MDTLKILLQISSSTLSLAVRVFNFDVVKSVNIVLMIFDLRHISIP